MKPNGDEALKKHLEVVGPLMERAGARWIKRYEVSKNLPGTDLPQFVSVIEYPNTEAIEMVFADTDYISLKPGRDMTFSKYDVCVVA